MVTQLTVSKASPQIVAPTSDFVQRRIDITFTLAQGNGTFPGGAAQVKLSGLRIAAKLVNAGGRSMGTLQAAIYGVRPSIVNALSTLGMVPTATRKNSVVLEAGDVNAGMSVVFQGIVTNAYADFTAAPQCVLQVIGQVGADTAVLAVPPISINGSADVATVMASIASQMGLAFENNNVNVRIANPYWPRTLREQALAIVQAAGIQWNGGANGVLAIWNTGSTRRGAVTLISPSTGMVGYPAFTSNGLMLKTLFNPKIALGSQVQVQSILPQANGTWVVYKIDHDLDALVPHGEWFSRIEAAVPGLVPVAP